MKIYMPNYGAMSSTAPLLTLLMKTWSEIFRSQLMTLFQKRTSNLATLIKIPGLHRGFLSQLNKNKLYKSYRASRTIYNKEKYWIFRNKFTYLIRKRKSIYYAELLQLSQGDSRMMWNVLKQVLNREQKDIVLPDLKNVTVILVNNFNNFFVSIGESLSNKINQPQGCPPKINCLATILVLSLWRQLILLKSIRFLTWRAHIQPA